MKTGVAIAVVGIVGLATGLGVYLSSQRGESASAGRPAVESATARELPDLQFQDGSGHGRSLAEFRGKVVVLNIWATWCIPCREEMPALDRLQAKLGGPGFEVVALSIDQQGPAVVRRFFDEMGIKALQLYVDPTAQAGFKLATVGIPATLLVDRGGREVWRRIGPAEWDAPAMVQDLRRMIEVPR